MTRGTALNQLKYDFRKWCGCLSIEEILENRDLVRVIERLERMFLSIGA